MYIYCATNLVNGKKYVGLTTFTVESRWNQHVKDSANSTTVFAKALRKYGVSSFRVVAIDNAETEEQLSYKEEFWINELSSQVPNGYNLTKGGFNGKATAALKKRLSRSAIKRFKKPEEKEAQSKRISEYHLTPGVKEAQSIRIKQAYLTNPKLIEAVRSQSLRRWESDRESIIAAQRRGWQSEDAKSNARIAAKARHLTNAYASKKKPVVCSDGKEYPSISDCAKFYGLASSHVRNCANDSRPMKNGILVSFSSQLVRGE